MRGDAVIDSKGIYRYHLSREWKDRQRRCCFIMLNPSTADAVTDDRTILRCVGFAKRWGYGAVDVVNLFAYRARKPSILKSVVDPVGPENDVYIKIIANQPNCERIVAAWGNHGEFLERQRRILSIIGRDLYCLGVTKKGQPRHPLYVAEVTPLIEYTS